MLNILLAILYKIFYVTLKKGSHMGRWKTLKDLQQIVIFNKSNDIQRPIAAILIVFCNNKLWFSYPIDLNVIIRKDIYYLLQHNFLWRIAVLTTLHPCNWLLFSQFFLLSRLTKNSSLVFDCRAYTCTRIWHSRTHAHTRKSAPGKKEKRNAPKDIIN